MEKRLILYRLVADRLRRIAIDTQFEMGILQNIGSKR